MSLINIFRCGYVNNKYKIFSWRSNVIWTFVIYVLHTHHHWIWDVHYMSGIIRRTELPGLPLIYPPAATKHYMFWCILEDRRKEDLWILELKKNSQDQLYRIANETWVDMIFGTICFVLHAKAGHVGLGDIHCKSTDTKQSKRNPQNKIKPNSATREMVLASRFVHSLVACPPWGPCGVRRQ